MTPEQESTLMSISMSNRGPVKAAAQARLRKAAADFALAIAKETNDDVAMGDVLITLNTALNALVDTNQETLL